MITTVTADGTKEYEFIELLKKRAQNSDKNVIPTVSEIIDNVRENGDKAVEEYTIKFDGKAPTYVYGNYLGNNVYKYVRSYEDYLEETLLQE